MHFQGTLVAYFGMPAFIATLAGLSIWRGTVILVLVRKLLQNCQFLIHLEDLNPFANLRNEYKEGNLEGYWETFGSFIDSNWLNFFRTFQMSMLIFILFFL